MKNTIMIWLFVLVVCILIVYMHRGRVEPYATDFRIIGPKKAAMEAKLSRMAKEVCDNGATQIVPGSIFYANPDPSFVTRNLVHMVVAIFPGAFAIAVWRGRGGDATGYTYKFHVDCARNARGYDVYVWRKGAKGWFKSNNDVGYDNWAMSGRNFKETWRSLDPKRLSVSIHNVPEYHGPFAKII